MLIVQKVQALLFSRNKAKTSDLHVNGELIESVTAFKFMGFDRMLTFEEDESNLYATLLKLIFFV